MEVGAHPVFEDDRAVIMDYSKYSNIAPYRGKEVEEAIHRILEHREYLGAFVSVLVGGNDLSAIYTYLNGMLDNIGKVKSYEDFQKKITAGVFVPTVIDRTMEAFTDSGSDVIDPSKGYLFLSNHRDIILDCALLDYTLLKSGKPLCEMAFGDNLMSNQFIEDLFRLNGGIIVRRALGMKEKYLSTIELSSYFVDVITKENISVWLAQRPGRSKDGIDTTQPAIIKMLYLSQKSSGISFSDLINKMNILPISISYEYDPNDINKGREEVLREHHHGEYEKKKYEDLISMARGMKAWKGRVHLAVGKPIQGEFSTPEEVAREVDRQIHLNYKLWDTNLCAYDYIEKTDRFSSELKDFDSEAFLARFNHLSPDVRDFVLNSYANPVRSRLQEEGE